MTYTYSGVNLLFVSNYCIVITLLAQPGLLESFTKVHTTSGDRHRQVLSLPHPPTHDLVELLKHATHPKI